MRRLEGERERESLAFLLSPPNLGGQSWVGCFCQADSDLDETADERESRDHLLSSQASVLMKRLSCLTETVLSNKIARNIE